MPSPHDPGARPERENPCRPLSRPWWPGSHRRHCRRHARRPYPLASHDSPSLRKRARSCVRARICGGRPFNSISR